jgi:hypothetical protein
LCDWLKEEVAIRVETAEMAHGLEIKPIPEARGNQNKLVKHKITSYRAGKQ